MTYLLGLPTKGIPKVDKHGPYSLITIYLIANSFIAVGHKDSILVAMTSDYTVV